MALYSSSTSGALTRPLVAEFVGTFVLVFVGCSVAVAGALQRPIAGPPYDSLAVAVAFGLTLAAVVAAIGPVSGGHVNPAVIMGQADRTVPVAQRARLRGRTASRGDRRRVRRLDVLRRRRPRWRQPWRYWPR